MLFLGSLSIQCKIRCNPRSDTRRSTDWCDQPVDHHWSISVLLHFLLVRILNVLPQLFMQSTFAEA